MKHIIGFGLISLGCIFGYYGFIVHPELNLYTLSLCAASGASFGFGIGVLER